MLEKRLATLPKTLAETYARILEEIPDDYRPNAIKILQFLTYSEHPISLEEAFDVIATDPYCNPVTMAQFQLETLSTPLMRQHEQGTAVWLNFYCSMSSASETLVK